MKARPGQTSRPTENSVVRYRHTVFRGGLSEFEASEFPGNGSFLLVRHGFAIGTQHFPRIANCRIDPISGTTKPAFNRRGTCPNR